jgi:hypothetical protein
LPVLPLLYISSVAGWVTVRRTGQMSVIESVVDITPLGLGLIAIIMSSQGLIAVLMNLNVRGPLFFFFFFLRPAHTHTDQCPLPSFLACCFKRSTHHRLGRNCLWPLCEACCKCQYLVLCSCPYSMPSIGRRYVIVIVWWGEVA